MTSLITINKMTSMEIAEVTGKEHFIIMRDIRDELQKLEEGGISGEYKFVLSSYTTGQNKEMPCYNLSKEGALQLAARYDAVVRAKLIERVTGQDAPMNPQLLIATALIEAQKLIESKDEQIMLMKPKAEFFDAVADSKTAIEMSQVAKVLNYGKGRNALFKVLRSEGILRWNNEPYQEYVDRGYFRVVEQKYIKPDGTTHISIKTLVYQKGVDYIKKMLDKHNSKSA